MDPAWKLGYTPGFLLSKLVEIDQKFLLVPKRLVFLPET